MIETLEISTAACVALDLIDFCIADLIALCLEQHQKLINRDYEKSSGVSHFNNSVISLRYAPEGKRVTWYIISWSEFSNLGVTFNAALLN